MEHSSRLVLMFSLKIFKPDFAGGHKKNKNNFRWMQTRQPGVEESILTAMENELYLKYKSSGAR